MTWTIEKAKEDLPDVRTIIPGYPAKGKEKIVICWLGGRKMKFATLTHPTSGMTCECSWPAVVRSLNSGGRPIII